MKGTSKGAFLVLGVIMLP